MGGGEGHVTEERMLLVTFDELQGPIGAHVDDEAAGADHAAVVIEGLVSGEPRWQLPEAC